MANVNAPFGLKPVRMLSGAAWNQQATLYYIPSSDTNAYYLGDVVQTVAGGDTLTGAPQVQLAGTRGSAFTAGLTRGVVVGIGTSVSTPGGNFPGAFDPNNLAATFIPATKAVNYFVWVVDDPNVVYEIACDSGNFAASSYNKNAAFTVGNAPTAPANQSQTVLQTSSLNTTVTLPLRVIGAPNRQDNDLVSSTNPYAKAYVILNTQDLRGNSVGV